MAKRKVNFYVVWQGRTPGIYTSWTECEAQIKGIAAKYKGFETRQEAEKALSDGFEAYLVPKGKTTLSPLPDTNRYIPLWQWMLPVRETPVYWNLEA